MQRPVTAQFATALTWGGIGLLAYLLYLVVEPFLVPLGWACVLAVLLAPVQARLTRRMSSGRASAVTTLAAALLLIVPATLLSNVFAHEMVDLAQRLQTAIAQGNAASWQQAWDWLVQRVPYLTRINVASVADDLLRRAASFLMAQSGSILTNIAVFFVDLVLALFATFFLLRDSAAIMHAVRRLLPMDEAAREAFIARTADLILAGVTSSVVVASLQGLLGGILFAVLGLSAPVFWGVVMALACLLPFGSGVVWLPAALFLMATGSMTKGIILIVLGAGVVSSVVNIVRPLLLSGRVQMNGLVIFVSLLGGLNVFGLLGIVLGPIVVVTAMALVTSYVEAVAE